MVTVNNSLNEDIKEFPVYKVYQNRIVPAPEIQSKDDYTHWYSDLHHFIKARSYKQNRAWYEEHGIEQKLILMPRVMHTHLENPVYQLTDEKFYNLYHIRKDVLLFNKKKWIEQQIRSSK